MPVVAPTAVRVRTSSGWVDVALVGPPGPAGASGAVVIYEQPNTPPVNAPIGSVWIDTDDPLPTPGTGPAGPAGPPGAQGPAGGNATVLMDIWHLVGGSGEPAFQNGWVNNSSLDPPAAFHKDPLGSVHIRGHLLSGTSGQTAFALPVGYRPPVSRYFPAVGASGAAGNFVYIDSTTGGIAPTRTGADIHFGEIEFDTELVTQMPTGPQGPAGPAGGSAYTGQIGDGTNSIFVVTHNLATRNVTVAVYRTVAPNDEIVCDVERTDANTVTIRTGSTVPTAGQYTVIVAAPGTISNPPAIPPPRVTSLPASPVDGQECYFVADAANGVLWRLRYNAGSAYASKWEFIGGAPLENIIDTDESFTANGAWTTLGAGPKVTLPLAGDYTYEALTQMYGTNAGATILFGVSPTPATPSPVGGHWAAQYSSAGGTSLSLSVIYRYNGLAAAAVLWHAYSISAGGNGHARYRRLAVKPVRVG